DGSATRLTDPHGLDLTETDSVASVNGVTYAHARTRGRAHLVGINADRSAGTVVAGHVVVPGPDAVADTVVVSLSSESSSGELALVRDGKVSVLTDFGAAQRDAGLVIPTELTVDARDGYPVHGWVVLPEGEGPHPVLLNIHGGPFAAYTVGLFDETQVLVDAGYAVVYSNPRGSAGYGVEHGRVIKNRMGTVDMTDVLDFLAGVVAPHPSLDGSRVGIMSGSYGGYLTAWTIAHDHRFEGAIVERGFLDPEGYVGTSDIGMFFGDE